MQAMELMDSRPADLYPPVDAAASGMLPLDHGHCMYWECVGSPEGIPVVFLHGGPGAGCTADHRRFFDPSAYRIVLFDQRGAGRSTPAGCIDANTTALLLADMERLREHLNIDRWLVFGGSWGSTLALAYGQAHPERCLGFILRGIFLGRQSEIHWFLYGMRQFFPEAWREFVRVVPASERADLLGAFHRRLTHPDPEVHMPAARAWSRYEAACSSLLPGHSVGSLWEPSQSALNLARIEAHYFVNEVFLAPDALLANIGRIDHLPCVIVQGRYDTVCPIASADELAANWPTAQYVIVPDAGHSAWEPGILAALVRATDSMKVTIGAGSR
jgi:proline iminopeptidase